MPELSMSPDYVARLMVKFRAVQAKEGLVDEDEGSNAPDDLMVDVLQDSSEDLTPEELREEIRGLGPIEQAELVALMWTGRGDAEPEDWQKTVEMAQERRETPTEEYLLAQPLVAEHWAEGLERLGIDIPIGVE